VKGDSREKDTLKPLVAEADLVIPLAALVGVPMCAADPTATNTTNRDAIKTLIKMMSKSQRIIMPVTNSGYGIGQSNDFCTEESPLRPISLYGQTKVEAEAGCWIVAIPSVSAWRRCSHGAAHAARSAGQRLRLSRRL